MQIVDNTMKKVENPIGKNPKCFKNYLVIFPHDMFCMRMNEIIRKIHDLHCSKRYSRYIYFVRQMLRNLIIIKQYSLSFSNIFLTPSVSIYISFSQDYLFHH